MNYIYLNRLSLKMPMLRTERKVLGTCGLRFRGFMAYSTFAFTLFRLQIQQFQIIVNGLRGKFIVTVSGCPCSTGTSISVTDPTPEHTLILVP